VNGGDTADKGRRLASVLSKSASGEHDEQGGRRETTEADPGKKAKMGASHGGGFLLVAF
jgi:hypothetical protein